LNVLKPHLQTTIWTLLKGGATQREIERVTGISRHTIRSYQQRFAADPANCPGVATDSPSQTAPPWPQTTCRCRRLWPPPGVRRQLRAHRPQQLRGPPGGDWHQGAGRIFERRIEIRDLRTHARVERPGTVVLPLTERVFNPSRKTRFILSQARAIGPQAARLCKMLFAIEGRVGQRTLWGIANLARRYIPHVVDRRKEIEIKQRDPTKKARRWVVEVCHSWFSRFRKLLVRYEKLELSFVALNHLTAAIIAFRKVPRSINIIYG